MTTSTSVAANAYYLLVIYFISMLTVEKWTISYSKADPSSRASNEVLEFRISVDHYCSLGGLQR